MTRNLLGQLAGSNFIVAPGVYDLISTRMAISKGFSTLYMTGFGTVASHLGLPDAGIASYRDMVDRVARMGEVCGDAGVALIADGDTGYGGPINVAHTVRGYEAAGASAIQLEDQTFPKKCGHTLGRDVIPTVEMVDKIKAAVDARRSDTTLIVARTDARTSRGLDEAIERMQTYEAAGADILFIESPESDEELQAIGRHFKKAPLVANMVEAGRTPLKSAQQLEAMGFRIGIFPTLGTLAAAAALDRAYTYLAREGASPETSELFGFDSFNELMGFPEVRAFEAKHTNSHG